VTNLKREWRDYIFAPLDVALVSKVLVTQVRNPNLFSEREWNLLFFHLRTRYTTSLMEYTCVLDLNGKSEKKVSWVTLQEAQAWAVKHARIVPGVGKYTVSIYEGNQFVKSLF
jgi:hypothetical protein